jgi:hypothetical protein
MTTPHTDAGRGPLTVVPCPKGLEEGALQSLLRDVRAIDGVQSVEVGDGGELRLRLHPMTFDNRRAWMAAVDHVRRYTDLQPRLHS